ncbi:unnamed protein product [Owenia fusiformis]|uniref:Uncharacterized protein n=1 Tax=Owenia fusiformis TaxID=6347 RepID=A0A8J1UPN6_OWEFU|nr:unnamed protein product [Owenia fusiformis]
METESKKLAIDNDPTKEDISKKKRPKQENEELSETTNKKTKTIDESSELDNDSIQKDKETVIKSKPVKSKKKKHKKSKVRNNSFDETELQGEKEKPDVQKLCLQYLKEWKTNKEKWSFQKVRQVWLLKHMYDVEKIPDEDFEILLSYLEGLKGKAREVTIQNAEELLNDDDSDSTDDDGGGEEAQSKTKPKGQKLSDKQCDRIRQVLQILP